MMEAWRPLHTRKGSPLPALIGAGLVIALIAFFASNGGRGSSMTNATPAPDAAVIDPTAIQAAALPVGDQHALNEEGKQLLKQGRCEEAITRFQAAFDANPTAHDVYEPLDNMAFCLYELDRKDEAIAKWRQALSIEPNSPDANAGIGMALYVTGHRDDGIFGMSQSQVCTWIHVLSPVLKYALGIETCLPERNPRKSSGINS